MGFFNHLLVSVLPLVPKPFVRLISRRYVAGETVEDMLGCVKRLNAQGCMATVDVLGEFITDMKQAHETAAEYHRVLEALHASQLDANVSIKLTAFGLLMDMDTCYSLVESLVQKARDLGNFVRIDMEDTPCTDKTIEIYLRLRKAGYTNTGIVLQAYLRRTLADAHAIIAAGAGHFRLCKGIYVEPRALAYKDPELVNKNYSWVLQRMLQAGAYVGIATHDEKLVWEAERIIDKLALTPERYEFQMLLGVEEELRQIIVDGGHRMRVYVPFGKQWYGYSIRRLKENPAIAGHVFRATMRRIFGGGTERRG